jgi:hypothetical protein
LLHLGADDGAVVDARLRGNFVLQYAMWLRERGALPKLRTLLMETPAAGQNWAQVFEQLAGLELPALRTLVVGRGGSTRKWVVPQVPAALLKELSHLELDGRLDQASFEGLEGLGLSSLTLHWHPSQSPDLVALEALIASLPDLEHLDLSAQIEPTAAEALFERLHPSKRLVIECLPPRGARLALLERLHPALAATKSDFEAVPQADEWWPGETGPLGTRTQAEMADPTSMTYRMELPDTRAHGRCSHVGPQRQDHQYWFGRLHGAQVVNRGKRVVQHYEQGQQLRQQVFAADGSLEMERHFESGSVREERFAAPPPPMPSGPYGDSFSGESTDALQVKGQRTLRVVGDLSPLQSTSLLQVFGPQIQTDSIQVILGASDDGSWALFDAQLRSTGEPLELMTTFMGDTRVGLILGQGRLLARIEDGEIVLQN